MSVSIRGEVIPLGCRPIALIGFMGVGKSAVGRRLARIMDYEFVDTDDLVEEAAGKPIAKIFEEDGEEAFRVSEITALKKGLSTPKRVVATGGGVTLLRENRDMLNEQASVVLLTAEPWIILRRVQPLEKRPLLADSPDPIRRIRELLRERAEAYAVHHFCVDTSSTPPRMVAEKIAAWYESQESRPVNA